MALGSLVASREIFKAVLRRILRSPMSFFDTTPAGRILSRLSKDIDIVDGVLSHVIREWGFSFFSVCIVSSICKNDLL